MDREKILESLYFAVDQVNELLPAEQQLARTPECVLFGSGGTLDSLGCVNLIVAAEERLNLSLETPVELAATLMGDDVAELPETLGALAEAIEAQLERGDD